MPRVRVNALIGAVHIQDPHPATGGLSVTVPAASYKVFDCNWDVFQRIAPQIADLETIGAATFTVSGGTDNFWAQEGDLPGMPRIDRVSKHDLTLAGEASIIVEGLYFLGGQSYASTRLDYTAANTDLLIYARTPGYWGNTLSAIVSDDGGGGLAISVVGGVQLKIDLGGATPDATTIAAAVNASATAKLLFKAVVDGTGAGTPTVKASQTLTGGEGPGLAVTCAGVACDVLAITDAHPNYSMEIAIPTMAGVSGAGEGVNLELRTGGKIATISLQIAP